MFRSHTSPRPRVDDVRSVRRLSLRTPTTLDPRRWPTFVSTSNRLRTTSPGILIHVHGPTSGQRAIGGDVGNPLCTSHRMSRGPWAPRPGGRRCRRRAPNSDETGLHSETGPPSMTVKYRSVTYKRLAALHLRSGSGRVPGLPQGHDIESFGGEWYLVDPAGPGHRGKRARRAPARVRAGGGPRARRTAGGL